MKKAPFLLFAIVAFCVYLPAFAQTTTETTAPTAKSEQSEPKFGPLYEIEKKDQSENTSAFKGLKVDKKFTRRLPNYYKDIVSDEQKQQVYDIQSSYFSVISLLELRLEKLKAERDAAIGAVLSKDQKKQLDEMQKEAAAKRAAARKNTN